MQDFNASAFLGHILSISIMAALAQKGIFSREETLEILDDALLVTEEHRAASPELADTFDNARTFLTEALATLPGQIGS